jgi:hypothetical protein
VPQIQHYHCELKLWADIWRKLLLILYSWSNIIIAGSSYVQINEEIIAHLVLMIHHNHCQVFIWQINGGNLSVTESFDDPALIYAFAILYSEMKFKFVLLWKRYIISKQLYHEKYHFRCTITSCLKNTWIVDF